jgi:hypothetical protein
MITFAEFVGAQKVGTFSSLAQARAAFAEAGICSHNQTCLGECIECGHKLNVEGTFKVNPDKTRYLSARHS